MARIIPWRKDNDASRSLAPRSEFPFRQIRNEFDALFDRFFGGWPSVFSTDWGLQPAWGWGLEMDDTAKEIVVRAEAPGFEPGDFDISITGNTLTIQAERKQDSKEAKGESSFSQRRLQRTVTLPAGVDPDKVDCRYKNGILELHLPRKEQAQAKRVEVKS